MNSNIHDWIFHYNIYTENWEGAKREHYVYLFSGTKPDYVIRAKRIEVLQSLVNKYNDAETINKTLTNTTII